MQQQDSNNKFEKDIEQILNILHQVPELEIPDRFHFRLSERLHLESQRMEALNQQTKKNPKRFYRIALSLTACIFVGILSYSMYNDDMSSIPRDAAAQEEMAPAMKSEEPMLMMVQEEPDYFELIDQYFVDSTYQLISYTTDAKTGEYIFQIVILTDEEGNPVNIPIVLIGKEGEIYEQR
jgi:hypothetical protein